MESIREIYKIGNGPSSSHTMGPKFAAERFKKENPKAVKFRVTLYGSLAATGKGHLTDKAITDVLKPEPVDFTWKLETVLKTHPNGMLFEAFSENGKLISSKHYYSVGEIGRAHV